MSQRNNAQYTSPVRKNFQQKQNYNTRIGGLLITKDRSILNDPILSEHRPEKNQIISIIDRKKSKQESNYEDFKSNHDNALINKTKKQLEITQQSFKRKDDRYQQSDWKSKYKSYEKYSDQEIDQNDEKDILNSKNNDQLEDKIDESEEIEQKQDKSQINHAYTKKNQKIQEDSKEGNQNDSEDDNQDDYSDYEDEEQYEDENNEDQEGEYEEDEENQNEEEEQEEEEEGEVEEDFDQDDNSQELDENKQDSYDEQYSNEDDQSEENFEEDNDIDIDNLEDDQDDEIENRVKQREIQPRLSESSYRMLGFEIRKINPSLPRGFAQRTLRDESGKRIVNQDRNELFNQSNQLRSIPSIEQSKARLLAKREELQIQKNQQQQQQDHEKYNNFSKEQQKVDQNNWNIPSISQNFKPLQYNSDAKTIQYYCERKWGNFQFIDDMCTLEDQQNATERYMYDRIFEVDQNFELNPSLIVKMYVRSNQGKKETIFRSDIGMIKSIHRLQKIFCDRQKRKQDGSLVNIDDIFAYISDRFRALRTDLKQIESQNSNIYIFRIQYLEQLIRIYLLSYLEMIQADQSCKYINEIQKKNFQEFLLKALDDLTIDYQTLFHEINESRFYLLDNLPEFISYYYLMLFQTILSTQSIQKLANLDIIFSECQYFKTLIQTSELQFCKLVKEYLIVKNYSALFDLGNSSKITLFQQFFIYLFQEQIEKYLEKENVYLNQQQEIQQQFWKEQLTLKFIDVKSICQKWFEIEDKISFINYKGNFSNVILGRVQIENFNYTSNQNPIQADIKLLSKQVDKKTQKMKSSIQEILLKFCQKQVLNKFTKFLAPHLDKIDQELGNFYKMQRILKHWRLSTITEKRYRQFVSLCKQKNKKNKKKIKLVEQQNFRIDLTKKLINLNANQKTLYYKIVILNNNESHNELVQKLIFSLCDQQFTAQDDSIIIQSDVTYQKNEYKLYMSIQILQNLEKERICGTDIFIVIENILDINFGKPCLQIIFDQKNKMESQDTIHLEYDYIALFDKLYESYEFNNKLNKIVDYSLKNKQTIEDLQLISLSDYFKEISRTECEDYKIDQIEYFITRCVQAELCLEDALKNNIYSDELPQELLFDRYINQELILKYVAKFNPANRLMIPLCNQLQKDIISERIILNEIKDYLDEYLDEEELLKLLTLNFKFGINFKGDWKLLFEFIIEQLVQYLENSDIYFVLKGNYNTILDQNQLKIRVQQDINQLIKKTSNQQQKSQTISKIFKFELGDLIKKKVCK